MSNIGSCKKVDCGLKDGLPCDIGHNDNELGKCPHYSPLIGSLTEQSHNSETRQELVHRLPWTGRAFGLGDIALVTSRSEPTLVGLIGPYNAGKTALLTSLFAHFSKAGIAGKYSFAGSFSLEGWKKLREYTQWPALKGPSFPPHTPDSGERVPSLLHLAFRNRIEQVRDVIFTDAPGEWFTRWIKNQSSEDSAGARWVVNNASHFLFVIDRSALSGPALGKFRHDILSMARVVAENLRGRKISVAWTKSDLELAPQIEVSVREKLADYFGEHPNFNLSVDSPNCLDLLIDILDRKNKVSKSEWIFIPKNESAFLSYNGE